MLYYRTAVKFAGPPPELETPEMFVAYTDADCCAVAKTLESMGILCLPPIALVCKIPAGFGMRRFYATM
jgi:hypothetical protein